MEYVTVRRTFIERMTRGFRSWRQGRHAYAAPATLTVRTATRTLNEQITSQPYPQHWSPARPRLRTDATPHLAAPYSSATRVVLHPGATADHLHHNHT